MKHLARLILSIESLIKNPVNWFNQISWILKMIIVFMFIPLISVISVLSYQNLTKLDTFKQNNITNTPITLKDFENSLEKYHDSQIEEILLLRKEINQLKQVLSITNPDLESSMVLGVHNSNDSEDSIKNIKERLTNFSEDSLKNPDMKSVYIKTGNPDTIMHTKPSESSPEVTDFELGVFYPALKEQDNWQEIDFGNGQTAWINKKYIINFPIDENY